MGASIADTLQKTVDWVRAEVAPKLEYRAPADGGAVDRMDEGRVHPSVYQLFVPSNERLREGERQAPSIAVQLLDGTDARAGGSRSLRVRLVLTIWSPGTFTDGGFERTGEGWRELFNGLDVIAGAVEAAEAVAGCSIDHGAGVSYGLMEFDNEIPDLYPYWMGRVDFTLAAGAPAKEKYRNLL